MEDMLWLDPITSEDIQIYGFEWLNENKNYHRLPDKHEQELIPICPNVVNLSKNTSGGQLHFRTNSKRLCIKATIDSNVNLAGMAPIARGGFDCYVGDDFSSLMFYRTSFYDPLETSYEYEFFNNNQKDQLIVINFPLYAGVKEVYIGIQPDAHITKALSFQDEERIVIYGTSITQGGYASRPGLSFTNILSRRLQREWINFGFSGNAMGEHELIEVISKVRKPSMFIVDYEANAGTNGKLEMTLEDIILTIRKNLPSVDIVILSRIPYLFDDLNPVLGSRRKEIRDFQRNMVKKMKKQGDEKIHFIDGSKLFGKNFHEFTIDSIHPNDLGFMKIADSLAPKLNQILAK